MAEYIDRNRLKEAIQEDALNSLSSYNGDLLNLILIEIDEAPAANVIQAPLFRVGDRVTFFGDKKPNKRKRGTVTQVLLEKGDKWHYTMKSRDGYGETRNFCFADDDIGVWVFPA